MSFTLFMQKFSFSFADWLRPPPYYFGFFRDDRPVIQHQSHSDGKSREEYRDAEMGEEDVPGVQNRAVNLQNRSYDKPREQAAGKAGRDR